MDSPPRYLSVLHARLDEFENAEISFPSKLKPLKTGKWNIIWKREGNREVKSTLTLERIEPTLKIFIDEFNKQKKDTTTRNIRVRHSWSNDDYPISSYVENATDSVLTRPFIKPDVHGSELVASVFISNGKFEISIKSHGLETTLPRWESRYGKHMFEVFAAMFNRHVQPWLLAAKDSRFDVAIKNQELRSILERDEPKPLNIL